MAVSFLRDALYNNGIDVWNVDGAKVDQRRVIAAGASGGLVATGLEHAV